MLVHQRVNDVIFNGKDLETSIFITMNFSLYDGDHTGYVDIPEMIPGFYNGISTAEVDTLAAETCSSDSCFVDGWDSVGVSVRVYPLLFMFTVWSPLQNSEHAWPYDIICECSESSPLRSWDDHKVISQQIWIWWTDGLMDSMDAPGRLKVLTCLRSIPTSPSWLHVTRLKPKGDGDPIARSSGEWWVNPRDIHEDDPTWLWRTNTSPWFFDGRKTK